MGEKVQMIAGGSFTFIDLFAGIGGFHHALEGLGGKCELAVEQDPACQAVYRAAFPSTALEGDIRNLTRGSTGQERSMDEIDSLVPDHDVLCAGFPCQPFSKSGFQEGVRDRTRGTLFFDVMSIVLAKRPRFVILENVRNLAGPRHRDTWTTIIASLRDAGYAVESEPLIFSPHRLRADEGGTPQVRERVFILAYRLDIWDSEVDISTEARRRVERSNWNPDRWDINEFLQPDDEVDDIERFRLRPHELGWIEAWQAFIEEIPSDWLPGFPIWTEFFHEKPQIPRMTPDWKEELIIKNSDFFVQNKTVIGRWRKRRWGPMRQELRDFPVSRQKFEWQARRVQPRREDRDLSKLVIQFRPSGIRVKAASYVPALVAMNQASIVGSRMRRITPSEAARLQGIPPEPFVLAGVRESDAYKQLGNAVHVGVVRFLVETMSELVADASEPAAV